MVQLIDNEISTHWKVKTTICLYGLDYFSFSLPRRTAELLR